MHARLRHMFRVPLINNLWLIDNNELLLTDEERLIFCTLLNNYCVAARASFPMIVGKDAPKQLRM
jgi:hypothetical protein